MVYDHLQEHDVTRPFIDRIEAARASVEVSPASPWTPKEAEQLQISALGVVSQLAERFGVTNLNRIKPGIAEATRAVLRRVPDQVLVRDRSDADVQLLIHLTDRAGIQVQEAGEDLGPYRAVTVIRGVS
ncbi:Cysteine protease StiP precursor [compost metagenome]